MSKAGTNKQTNESLKQEIRGGNRDSYVSVIPLIYLIKDSARNSRNNRSKIFKSLPGRSDVENRTMIISVADVRPVVLTGCVNAFL